MSHKCFTHEIVRIGRTIVVSKIMQFATFVRSALGTPVSSGLSGHNPMKEICTCCAVHGGSNAVRCCRENVMSEIAFKLFLGIVCSLP